MSERGDRGGGRWRAFEEERGGGVEAWLLLACAARAAGDRGGAVSMFRRALAVDPNCLEGAIRLCMCERESLCFGPSIIRPSECASFILVIPVGHCMLVSVSVCGSGNGRSRHRK